ncbi:hypothetical protein [Cryptosporangium sp. NPDC051539]|uniref:hypothetical protein n=1 Tax=Cryptosporangium sp. NPDC051539 TaxID=3363962 RepID=UPI0037BD2720
MSPAFMPRLRTRGAVVALVLCAFVATGCGAIQDAAEEAATAAKSPETPQEKLLASVPTSDTGPYAFTQKNTGAPDGTPDITGVVNPPGKSSESRAVVTNADPKFVMKMDFRVIAKDSWLHVAFEDTDDVTGLPSLPDKWMQIDPSKLKNKEEYPIEWGLDSEDPAGVEVLFGAVVDAKDAGPGAFSGTLDLTKSRDSEAVDEEIITALGPKANAVPFTAKLDAEGRTSEVVLQVPASAKNKAYTYTITLSDYGTATPVTTPKDSEIAATPPGAYELLNA